MTRIEEQRAVNQLMKMAGDSIKRQQNERPEVLWLRTKYETIQRKYYLKNRLETDRFLFQRIYGRSPRTQTEYLKIRYWRTGRYTPLNRKLCEQLGKALELTGEDRKFLLQGYYDRSLEVYDAFRDSRNEKYQERCRKMQQLVNMYVNRIPEQTLELFHIRSGERKKNFRHLYFTDALRYVDFPEDRIVKTAKKHITSTRYDSELRRQIHLHGEIPRKTMIRHLIIWNMPELSCQKISSQLEYFGYLPLSEKHTMTSGEYLDRLLICLLRLYEEMYDPKAPENSYVWMCQACRLLDRFFKEQGRPNMRFMHFKALEL